MIQYFIFVHVLLLGFSVNAQTESLVSTPQLTYDLGISTGSENGVRYNEFNLGLNAFFTESINWRNAGFYRVITGEAAIYGLDSSLRLDLITEIGEEGRIGAFGGPGYRFVSRGENVPFVEAGLRVSIGGLTIGGGAKMFVYQLVQSNAENETQFFLILSGSGRL